MRKLLVICGVLLASSVGLANSKLSTEDCVSRIYENAGAKSRMQAQRICQERDDADFVQCAEDLYNDLDANHTFESATETCFQQVPVPAYIRLAQGCVTILRGAGFDIEPAIELCDSTLAETGSLAIPKCIYRSRSSRDTDAIIDSCRRQFNRGELDNEGRNKVEMERARQEAAARAEQERQRQIEAARQEQARRQAEASRLAELQRQADAKRQREYQERQERLAIQKAENDERQRRLELERQANRQRWEEQQRRRAEERPVVIIKPEPKIIVVPKREEPKREEPKRIEQKPNTGVSQAEKARRAEELRRQEEERNWQEMQREEKARQQRERQARENESKKKQEVTPIPRPKVDIPDTKIPKKVDQGSSNGKKDQGLSDEERQRREDEVRRKSEEGRKRVEQAKKEAEERARLEKERKEKEQQPQTPSTTGDGTGDVPPPPSSGDFEDLPNPTASVR
jgi:hypothetical protein